MQKIVPPQSRVIIAAATWLRVNAEAQQPNETNSPPIRIMPRKGAGYHTQIEGGRIVGKVANDKQTSQERQPGHNIEREGRR